MRALTLEDAARAVEDAREAAERLDAQGWPAPLDLVELDGREPEPPAFLVPGWLPEGAVTLLSGHGGSGKSGLALGLAVAIATGRPWCGLPTSKRRTLFLSAEDRAGVLHWRLARLSAHMGVRLAELAGRLDVIDAVGADVVLWEPRRQRDTAGLAELRQRVAEGGHEFVVLDGAADTFGGSELDRAHVKHYVNAILSAVPATGAVLLIGHVNRNSAMGVTGRAEAYSGSTGWNNSARARWALMPEKTASPEGEADDSGDMLLTLEKINAGRPGATLRFSWDSDAGLFVGREVVPESLLDVRARERRERDALVRCVAAVEGRGDFVPSAATGQRTALHVLAAEPEFPASLAARSPTERRRFWRHIEELRRMGVLRELPIRRPDGHKRAALTLENRNA